MDMVSKELLKSGAQKIENIGLLYPYSLFDIRYEINGLIRYAIVANTSTKVNYFNLSIKRNVFVHAFSGCCDVFLITNILEKPKINRYNIEKLDGLNKTINSIKFTDEGE